MCNLLKLASNLVKDIDNILFSYADINCCLKIKWKYESREGNFFYLYDLKGLIEDLI